MPKQSAPWESEIAKKFLVEFNPYNNVMRKIEDTLALDPKSYPNEIRAAAAMVILLCREGLWPTRDGIEGRDKVLHMAARQLTTIKQLFEQRARSKPELQANRKYRTLLTTLDEEVRILEARLSDPKPPMPDEPPVTWGNFWP